MMSKLLFIVLLSAGFIAISPTKALSQSDPVIEGNVLGYELHEIKPFGMDGTIYEYPALVKVTKITEGEENSQYIIVLLKPLKKDYAETNFGSGKTSVFKLVRRTNYFLKPKYLLRKGIVIKNGKVERGQKFTFVPGVNKKDLPLDKKLPVYVEIEKR